MTRAMIARFAIAAATASFGCGDDGDDRGACGDFNWRAETADQIVCPYTAACACPTSDVCCVTVSNDAFDDATCEQLADCPGLAFECDGPEDCAEGDACCADTSTGGGSTCGAPTDCMDIDEVLMCREDDDCNLGESCLPAEDGTYFDGVAGYCSL
jgi:hypothetical protein